MSIVQDALRGVVHGKRIELDQESGLPDGQPVAVTVRPVFPPGEGVRRSAGAWADGGAELDEWFEKVRRCRKLDRREP